MIANLNENSPGYECQLSSMIQETSRRTESRRGETSRSWVEKILNKRKVRGVVKYLVW